MLALSYFLHLVATVVWIGGLLLMTLLVLPEARRIIEVREGGTVILELLDRIRKRFYPVANLSLVVLFVTGFFQTSSDSHYDGLLQFTNDWSRAILLKHIAVFGMIGIGVLMQWGVFPAIDRANLRVQRGKESPELGRLLRRERQLTLLNCALGVIVLFFTAVATSI